MTDTFAHAAAQARPDCPKCKGTGVYLYDGFHGKICEDCCRHDLGYWQLLEHYGENNGRWCCKAGCGHKVDSDPAAADRLAELGSAAPAIDDVSRRRGP